MRHSFDCHAFVIIIWDNENILMKEEIMMMHGNIAFGIAFTVLHIAAVGGFFYFIYNISKSLKRIADHFEKEN